MKVENLYKIFQQLQEKQIPLVELCLTLQCQISLTLVAL